MGLLIVDRDGTLVDANAQIERIFGYPRSQIIGRHIEALLPQRHHAAHRAHVAAFFADPDSRLMGRGRNLLGRDATGREFDVEIGIHPLAGEPGPQALATVVDISGMVRERARQALAAAIVESTEDAIVGIDHDGVITSWNDSATRMFGYGPGEMIGRRIAALAPPALVAEQSDFVARATESGQTARYETVRLTRDGRAIDVAVTLSLIRQAGSPVGISFAYRDIGQRKQMERALLDSESKYRAIVEDSTDLISLSTPDGRLVFVNDAYARHFGLTSALMLGRNLLDFVVAEDRASVAAQLASVVTTGVALTGENRMLQPDGRERWVDWTNRALRDAAGHCVTIHSLGRDVTERKRIENALAASERRYRMLHERSPAMLHSIDHEGRLVDVSNHWLATLGYARDAVVGRALTDFLTAESAERARTVVLPEFFRTERCDDIEYQMVREDGAVIDVLLSATLERDEFGRPLRSMAMLVDITARRKAESEARERDAAERASRAKSEFLARMSHELRTPLNAILGFAQLLGQFGRDGLPERQQAQLAQIESAGWHLLNLVNEVLDISRIESGRLELTIADIDPPQAVAEALALERGHAERFGVAVVVEPALPGAWRVRADATRLRQVLLNLLSNAIKYNRPGGGVRIAFALPEPGRLAIIVRDTGIGMDATQRAHLFEPFARLGMEKSRIQGVGMGLVVSRLLVEHMGGRILVDSRPGEGSEFSVVLPAVALRAH